MKKASISVLMLALALLLSACGGAGAKTVTKEELEDSVRPQVKGFIYKSDEGETSLEGNTYMVDVYDAQSAMFAELAKDGNKAALESWHLTTANAESLHNMIGSDFKKAGHDNITIEYTIYAKPLKDVSRENKADILYRYSAGTAVIELGK